MTIERDVYPADPSGSTFQIERMIEIACKRPEFRKWWESERKTPQNLTSLRRALPDIWKRMTQVEKVKFEMSYFTNGAVYLVRILQSLEELGVNVSDEKWDLIRLAASVERRAGSRKRASAGERTVKKAEVGR